MVGSIVLEALPLTHPRGSVRARPRSPTPCLCSRAEDLVAAHSTIAEEFDEFPHPLPALLSASMSSYPRAVSPSESPG